MSQIITARQSAADVYLRSHRQSGLRVNLASMSARRRNGKRDKASYPSFDLVALQATALTLAHVSIFRLRMSKYLTNHICRHGDLHHADTNAIQEASNEKHRNMSRPALDSSRDNADGTDYLNRPTAAKSIENPVDNESTNDTSASEQTISS